jgi:hypothetical protein
MAKEIIPFIVVGYACILTGLIAPWMAMRLHPAWRAAWSGVHALLIWVSLSLDPMPGAPTWQQTLDHTCLIVLLVSGLIGVVVIERWLRMKRTRAI